MSFCIENDIVNVKNIAFDVESDVFDVENVVFDVEDVVSTRIFNYVWGYFV